MSTLAEAAATVAWADAETKSPATISSKEGGVGAAVGDHVPPSVGASDGTVRPEPTCAR